MPLGGGFQSSEGEKDAEILMTVGLKRGYAGRRGRKPHTAHSRGRPDHHLTERKDAMGTYLG